MQNDFLELTATARKRNVLEMKKNCIPFCTPPLNGEYSMVAYSNAFHLLVFTFSIALAIFHFYVEFSRCVSFLCIYGHFTSPNRFHTFDLMQAYTSFTSVKRNICRMKRSAVSTVKLIFYSLIKHSQCTHTQALTCMSNIFVLQR